MSTDYAGEGIRIALENPRPKTYDNTQFLTKDEVASVTLEIFNADFSTSVFGPVNMIWLDDEETWVYVWNTASPAIDPGTYKGKVIIIDFGGVPSIEYVRIRLKRRPDL